MPGDYADEIIDKIRVAGCVQNKTAGFMVSCVDHPAWWRFAENGKDGGHVLGDIVMIPAEHMLARHNLPAEDRRELQKRLDALDQPAEPATGGSSD